jgi:hypothetical protein
VVVAGQNALSRFAKSHATDANQPAIIDALEGEGCRVYQMERPVDLLVEYDRIWIVIEVKNPKGKNKLEGNQIDFFKITRAPAYVVRSEGEAIGAVRDAAKQNRSMRS